MTLSKPSSLSTSSSLSICVTTFSLPSSSPRPAPGLPLPFHCYCVLLSPSLGFPLPAPLSLSTSLVSEIISSYTLTSKDSDLGSTNKREHEVFVWFWVLGYLTLHVSQFHPFPWKFHDFTFLCSWIEFHHNMVTSLWGPGSGMYWFEWECSQTLQIFKHFVLVGGLVWEV